MARGNLASVDLAEIITGGNFWRVRSTTRFQHLAADVSNAELALTPKFRHRAIHKPTNFFQGDEHHYIAGPDPRCERLTGSLNERDELAMKLDIQDLYLLLWCHKNGLAYLGRVFDNIWYEDRGHLILVGCDTSAELPQAEPAAGDTKRRRTTKPLR
jgi:hypothetical protein